MDEVCVYQFLQKEKQNICFVLGGVQFCYFILRDKKIKVVRLSFNNLQRAAEVIDQFVQINSCTVINTYLFVEVLSKKEREILMKTGNVLKVSRNKWKYFK